MNITKRALKSYYENIQNMRNSAPNDEKYIQDYLRAIRVSF